MCIVVSKDSSGRTLAPLPLADEAFEVFYLAVQRDKVDGANSSKRVAEVARCLSDGSCGECVRVGLQFLANGRMAREAHGDGFGAALRLCKAIDELDYLGGLA